MLTLKEEFQKLSLEKIKGEVIGLALENHFNFILEKEGMERVKEVEERLNELGYPLRYKEIKSFQWYPRIIDEAIYFVIKKTLAWNDEKFRESGKWGAKVSFITKIMMRYFLSIEEIFAEINNYWRKYYTIGNLEPKEINLKEKYLVFELKNFPILFPEHCRYWEGYFWQVASYVLPKEKLKLTETECTFKGGKTHQFKGTW